MPSPADVFGELNANSLKMVRPLAAKAFPVDDLKLPKLPRKEAMLVIIIPKWVSFCQLDHQHLKAEAPVLPFIFYL